jgi:hypothetical protein
MRMHRFFTYAVPFLFLTTSHALMLGGVNVPKEKVIVYLLIGHSNMGGVETRAPDNVAHARGWNYTWSTTPRAWVPAKEAPGSAKNGLSTRGEGGPGMPFIKQMADAYPEYHIGVISNASYSSTCKGVNTGNNTSGIPVTENRYWKGARLYNEILTAAKEVQADVTFGGIICMLGTVEATRSSDEIVASFSDDISQMAKDLRADLGLPNLPFMMGEYETGSSGEFATSLPWPGTVLAQTRLIPSKLPNSALISSQGVAMKDDHHYAWPAGQTEFAKRCVAAIASKQWMPPGGLSSTLRPVRPGVAGNRPGLRILADRETQVAFRDGIPYFIDGKIAINHARIHAVAQP